MCYLDELQFADMVAVQLYQIGDVQMFEMGGAQFFLNGYCTVV